jgi:hypothetical protein
LGNIRNYLAGRAEPGARGQAFGCGTMAAWLGSTLREVLAG